jgi:hypothetical protein
VAYEEEQRENNGGEPETEHVAVGVAARQDSAEAAGEGE